MQAMSDQASQGTTIRSMQQDDWLPAPIEPWKYSNPGPLTGFQRRDCQGGNPLHPIPGNDSFEEELAARLQEFRNSYPAVIAGRHFTKMPCWNQDPLPKANDYVLVNAPQRLTTTSVTIVLVPNEPARSAEMGFYFKGRSLPALRARMEGSPFQGLVGNLGYFMTDALIEGAPWSHNLRYPQFPLPKMPSYIGFHLHRDGEQGEAYGSFQGAHPAAVGVRRDGSVGILAGLSIDRYQVMFGGPKGIRVDVEAINPSAPIADVVLFTPAFQGTTEIRQSIQAAEASAGTDDGWQQCKPMIPASESRDRVNIFIASKGNGQVPVEKVVALWDGPSPLPSFGGLLSFDRTAFESLFGSVVQFQKDFVGSSVQVIPHGTHPDLDDYVQIMGGFVPAIVDHAHIYYDAGTARRVMKALTHYGATSPIAQCGRETKNFDLQVREPAAVLLQTKSHIGWVLFDGRHEMSIGASIVDVAAILKKLEDANKFEASVQHAFFVDGGSAMKAYHVRPGQPAVSLDLLNRVAAGSRNGPGADTEGLNLYTLLKLHLDPMV
jgi:hypothetical protein